MQALRALRALRPLRTINRFDNLRAVVVAFVDALPMLGSVVLLTVVALSLWALMSMQLFIGMYHTACREDSTGLLEVTDTSEFSCGARRCDASCAPWSLLPCVKPCSSWDSGTSHSVPLHARSILSKQSLCRCAEGWTCVDLQDSLAYNVPGVDNFAKALLSMFQCVTLSAWSYMQARSA